MKTKLVLLLPSLLLIGCNPFSDNVTRIPARANTYEQPFKTDVVWIALERFGGLAAYGSGFLKDKYEGTFYTNKHVSDMFNTLGEGSHKIFFNGKVYDAKLERPEELADAVIARITSEFDPSEFPDPKPLAERSPEVGEKVIIEGFHPHPYEVRFSDKEEGYDYPEIPILRDYYGMGTVHLDKEREVVFEKIEAEVVELNVILPIGDERNVDYVQALRNRVNLHTRIKTVKNHKFPFGGLSGTRVINEQGEVVGIFTAAKEWDVDPLEDEELDLPEGHTLGVKVNNMGLLTPVEAFKDLDK